MTPRPTVVRTAGLIKDFGRTRALDGLDLEVGRGEVHGFLGPNGAGKTTTLRILLGLVQASSGHAEVLGGNPWTQAPALHARLAYVAGDVALWPGLTGGQCLDLLASAGPGTQPSRQAALVDRFELDPSKRVRDYSKGNRQKVALVAALASRAELLVLDEPTSGLDPLMEQVFLECVRERRDHGDTVLLSSHLLGEVEALADRVTIVRQGRTVVTGTLAELRRHTRTSVLAVTDQVPHGLVSLPGIGDHTVDQDGSGVTTRLTVEGRGLDDVLGSLHTAHIQTLTVAPPSLDALFLEHYREGTETDPGHHRPRPRSRHRTRKGSR